MRKSSAEIIGFGKRFLMKKSEVIQTIKDYCAGSFYGIIDEATTRDKVLFGNTDEECTGVVTTCFASADVIRKAAALGCNLIIPHEALVWNHGDHQEWLQSNRTYQAKAKLLNDNGITVWRCHDHIHNGVPLLPHQYVDGIFYGFAKEAGWDGNIVHDDAVRASNYSFHGETALQLAQHLVKTFNLNGTRIVGDPETRVQRLRIVGHIDGRADNEILKQFEEDNIDCAITLECTDYTFNEYIRDSAQLNLPKAIIMLGHFNAEEPGMKYMAESWLPQILPEIPVHFVASGDPFRYVHI